MGGASGSTHARTHTQHAAPSPLNRNRNPPTADAAATAAAAAEGMRRKSERRTVPVNKDYQALDTHGNAGKRSYTRRTVKKDKTKEKAKQAQQLQ
jgi:hypothetical protein